MLGHSQVRWPDISQSDITLTPGACWVSPQNLRHLYTEPRLIHLIHCISHHCTVTPCFIAHRPPGDVAWI